MSLHINRFIDRLKACESRNQRDVTLTLQEARDLHADVTRLLLRLQDLEQQRESAPRNDDVITVEVQGGTF